MSDSELIKKFHSKIKLLNETLWDGKVNKKKVDTWLENFEEDEKIHALYLLTQFVYFGEFQIKKMLVSIYRDFFQYRHFEEIRKKNGDTLDENFIKSKYKEILLKTRFVSIGNTSESSSHIMYPFRTENNISTDLFINCNEISSCPNDVEHFVFIDDICGSGTQACIYTAEALVDINKLFPNAKKHYYILIGTQIGKNYIKNNTDIDYVDSILDLDSSFRCFDSFSRIFKNKDDIIDIDKIKEFSGRQGKILIESIVRRESPMASNIEIENASERNKFGFSDGQLLVAFHHNTPDNTLPIFWYGENMVFWNPIFKRANKIY